MLSFDFYVFLLQLIHINFYFFIKNTMQYLKKYTSFILIILTFILSFFIFNHNLVAKTINSEELISANKLADLKIIVNQKNDPSKYNLDENILRQEVAGITLWLAKLPKNKTCQNKFFDISSIKPNTWTCNVVESLLDAWIITQNTKFNPETNITKSEALWMIVKAIYGDLYNYDSSKNSLWQEQLISFSVKNNIVTNFNDYNTKATRWWIFIVADNVIENAWSLLKDDFKPTTDEETKICAEVITNAINPETNECVEFSNSCTPEWWKIVWECEPIKVNYIKKSTTIEFAWTMNKTSVKENFRIFPEVETNLEWISDTNLKIEIDEIIENKTDFTINILDKAIYDDWTTLEKTIIKNFKTSKITKIDFISPEWEITDLTKNITVRFNKPIVSLTNFDNQLKCPIKIIPDIPWKCVWITTSTFQFRPEQWFPIWAIYSVHIPSWIKAIDWSKTSNSKTVEIKTPKFEITNTQNNWYTDKPLLINFNSPISLENFKSNFNISWFNNKNLKIDYFISNQYNSEIKEIKRNIISIFPKNGDWWYGKKYSYNLWSWLKSYRWNVIIWTSKKYNYFINELLLSHSPFIYKNLEEENLELSSNIKVSNNKDIITKNNPNILLNFYEEYNFY